MDIFWNRKPVIMPSNGLHSSEVWQMPRGPSVWVIRCTFDILEGCNCQRNSRTILTNIRKVLEAPGALLIVLLPFRENSMIGPPPHAYINVGKENFRLHAIAYQENYNSTLSVL